jgi:hypothetical protein
MDINFQGQGGTFILKHGIGCRNTQHPTHRKENKKPSILQFAKVAIGGENYWRKMAVLWQLTDYHMTVKLNYRQRQQGGRLC